VILDRLFKTRRASPAERRVYDAIVAQARQPWLYDELGVPDTLDGRYEMIVFYATVVMERLQRADAPARAFAQRLFDEMFADMDRSLREMGVGDLSVGKRIRVMAEIFYGRAAAYREALRSAEEHLEQRLREILVRNLFPDAPPPTSIAALARELLAQHAAIGRQSPETILGGEVHFAPPAHGSSSDAYVVKPQAPDARNA
jgi:cytochrome b pre-mRNA-processing protein 3